MRSVWRIRRMREPRNCTYRWRHRGKTLATLSSTSSLTRSLRSDLTAGVIELKPAWWRSRAEKNHILQTEWTEPGYNPVVSSLSPDGSDRRVPPSQSIEASIECPKNGGVWLNSKLFCTYAQTRRTRSRGQKIDNIRRK